MHQKQLEPIIQKIDELKRKQQQKLLEKRAEKKASAHLTKTTKKLPTDEMCVICLERPILVALKPCGHVCLCQKCFRKSPPPDCPLCRCPITGTLKVYFP